MAELQTAVNAIIGKTTDEGSGLRYFSNWSTTATPGAGAPNALTINVKCEASPWRFMGDPDAHFPALYFQIRGMFPATQVRGTHYECTFRVRCFLVGKIADGEYQDQEARENVTALVENIMASNKLGLDWVDSVEWNGCDYDNDIADAIHVEYPDYYCGATMFTIRASGLTF